MDDLISRETMKDLIDITTWYHQNRNKEMVEGASDEETAWFKAKDVFKAIENVPSALQEKETAKRVLWSGWKGNRYTRYYCPNCKKLVRNDDVYCHRCGQKLMFPHISFSDYVPGEIQKIIVRWDNE